VTGKEGGPGIGDPGGAHLDGEGGGDPGGGRCDDPSGPAGGSGSAVGAPGMGALMMSLSPGGVLETGGVIVPTAARMGVLPGMAFMPGHHEGRHGLIRPHGALQGSERDHAGGEEHEQGKEASHQVRKMDMDRGGRQPRGWGQRGSARSRRTASSRVAAARGPMTACRTTPCRSRRKEVG
jgi:hypothetical protein